MSTTEKKLVLIDYNDLVASMPIRLNHYDKEHGNIHYVYGIELVMETAEWLANNKRVEAIPIEQLSSILQKYDDYIHTKTYPYNRTMEDIYSKGYEVGWNACLKAIKEELDYWEKENDDTR